MSESPNLHVCQRFFQWLFSWRIIRGVLLSVAAFITLVATYLTEERWRGERDWVAYKSQQQAKGTWVDYAALSQAGGSSAAMTPLLDAIFLQGGTEGPLQAIRNAHFTFFPASGKNAVAEPSFGAWREGRAVDLKAWEKFLGTDDIVKAMNESNLKLDEVSAEFRQQPVRLPGFNTDEKKMLNLNQMLLDGHMFAVRADAELAQGQPARAADDLLTIFRMAQTLSRNLSLTSQLVAIADILYAVQVIWDGLAARQWPEEQLAMLQEELSQMDFPAWVQNGFRLMAARQIMQIEAALADNTMPANPRSPEGDVRMIVRKVPRGWLYQNMITSDQYFQNLAAAFDPTHHRIDLAQVQAAGNYFVKLTSHWWPHTFLAGLWGRNLGGIVIAVGEDIEGMDLAIVACALERYRLANGQLPEKLEDLLPKYLAKIPADVFSGKPMVYKQEPAGQYRLSLLRVDSYGGPWYEEVWKSSGRN